MKFGPFIAVTIGIGALVGWFAPGDPGAAPKISGAAQPGEAQLAALQQDQWLAGEVVLERAVDGHFYADIDVSGATAHMLVDTGASTVALTTEDAARVGVDFSEEDFQPIGTGASGAVRGVRTTLDSVDVDGKEVPAVEAVVIEGLEVSLLGQSYLSRLEAVSMSGDTMVLR